MCLTGDDGLGEDAKNKIKINKIEGEMNLLIKTWNK